MEKYLSGRVRHLEREKGKKENSLQDLEAQLHTHRSTQVKEDDSFKIPGAFHVEDPHLQLLAQQTKTYQAQLEQIKLALQRKEDEREALRLQS
jgi:hypothetical protein